MKTSTCMKVLKEITKGQKVNFTWNEAYIFCESISERVQTKKQAENLLRRYFCV